VRCPATPYGYWNMQGVDCGAANARLNDRKICCDRSLLESSLSCTIGLRGRRAGDGESPDRVLVGIGLGGGNFTPRIADAAAASQKAHDLLQDKGMLVLKSQEIVFPMAWAP
jgi:hypothetical protein